MAQDNLSSLSTAKSFYTHAVGKPCCSWCFLRTGCQTQGPIQGPFLSHGSCCVLQLIFILFSSNRSKRQFQREKLHVLLTVLVHFSSHCHFRSLLSQASFIYALYSKIFVSYLMFSIVFNYLFVFVIKSSKWWKDGLERKSCWVSAVSTKMQRCLVMWVLKECKYFSQEDGFLYKSCLWKLQKSR